MLPEPRESSESVVGDTVVCTDRYLCGNKAHLWRVRVAIEADQCISGFVYTDPTRYESRTLPSGAIELTVTTSISRTLE